MNKISFYSLILFIFLSTAHNLAFGQWSQDYNRQMNIPDLVNLHSSEAHFYALSESEGLVVFRAHTDSLQWLYSSTGMQQRGQILDADIRFAYLYGNSRRLTVIEPTSVLGVYSSTVLPARPQSVKRINDNIYIALGNRGLGTLSLETPESVDSDVQFIDTNRFNNRDVIDLATNQNRVLYVLSSGNNIDIYEPNNNDQLEHQAHVQVNRDLEKVFLTRDELIGSDDDGEIFYINSNGQTSNLASVGSSVQKLHLQDDQLVVHTESNELWIGIEGEELTRWKADERAGNLFAVTEDQLWISEYENITPVIFNPSQTQNQSSSNSPSSRLELKEIPNITLPFPRPLILPIELESRPSNAEITYSFEAPFNNARIRGNTLYWQPTANQTGRQNVEITATSSDGQTDRINFSIDLRTFNSPPRFTPNRPITVPVGEAFQTDVKATDPDGLNPDLIRYLGVDMPSGARLNERTGLFSWTPNIRQVGTHEFQVIATDQYGAAASQDYEIRVVEMSGGETDPSEEDS